MRAKKSASRYRELPPRTSPPDPNRALTELEIAYRAYRWERRGLLSGLTLLVLLGLSTGITFFALNPSAPGPEVASQPAETPSPAADSTAEAPSEIVPRKDPAPSLKATLVTAETPEQAPDTAAVPPPRVPLSPEEIAAARQRWEDIEAEQRRLDARAAELQRQWPALREQLESKPFLDLTAPIHVQYEDEVEVRQLAEIYDDLDVFADNELPSVEGNPALDKAQTREELNDTIAAAENNLNARRIRLETTAALLAGARQAAPIDPADLPAEEPSAAAPIPELVTTASETPEEPGDDDLTSAGVPFPDPDPPLFEVVAFTPNPERNRDPAIAAADLKEVATNEPDAGISRPVVAVAAPEDMLPEVSSEAPTPATEAIPEVEFVANEEKAASALPAPADMIAESVAPVPPPAVSIVASDDLPLSESTEAAIDAPQPVLPPLDPENRLAVASTPAAVPLVEASPSRVDGPSPSPSLRANATATALQLPPELAFLPRLASVPGFNYAAHMERFSGDGLTFTFEVLDPPYVVEIPLFAYDRWRDLLAELDRQDLVSKTERRGAESLLGYQRFALALPDLQRAGLYVDPAVHFNRVRVTEAAGLR